MSFAFHYERDDFGLVDENDKRRFLSNLVLAEGRQIQSVAFIFCSDDYLLDLNQRYLDHHDYTDVLTFPYQNDPIDGEIYISVDRVRENALLYRASEADELLRTMIHGLLHLCGYDDRLEEEMLEMRRKENLYLEKFHHGFSGKS